MKKLLLSSALLLSMLMAGAQNFSYKVAIDNPDSSGFYRVTLPASFIAKSQNDLADIRLMFNNKQVPYIVRTENGYNESAFTEFPVVSRRIEADSLNHIVCYNPDGAQVAELYLTIANTEADRSVSISGSNDSLQWYIIKENILLEKKFEEKNQFVQAVAMPATNYKFYNISINEKNLIPFNILKIGTKASVQRMGSYQTLSHPAVDTHSAAKKTYVNIIFDDNYQVDEINIKVSAPRYFNRSASVFAGDSTGELLGNFNLISGKPLLLPVNHKRGRLHLQINDGDSPPLVIDSIVALQYNRYIVAYLEEGNNYELFTGDLSLKAPTYDLSVFANEIGKNIKPLKVSGVSSISTSEQAVKKSGNTLIWLTIGVALIVLLIVTSRMLNEVKKKAV